MKSRFAHYGNIPANVKVAGYVYGPVKFIVFAVTVAVSLMARATRRS